MPNEDNTSPAIQYSSGWSTRSAPTSQAEGGSWHVTSNVGATATIRFTGTEITVFGVNPAGSGKIRATFTIDGRSSPWEVNSHHVAYYRDRFWSSGHLSQGTHTLVVQNTGSEVPLHLDYFSLSGSAITPAASTPQPQPTQTTPQQTTNRPPETTVVHSTTHTVSVTQTFTDTQTNHITGTVSTTATATDTSTDIQVTTSTSTDTVSISTTPTNTSSTPSSTSDNVISQSLSVNPSNGETVTAFQVVTSSISGVGAEVTIYPDSNGNFNPAAASSKSIGLGAIIGAVVGSAVFLLFLILFVVLCLRRRRRAAVLAQSVGDNEKPPSVRGSAHRAHPSISAFPARLSESLRPALGSKLRSHQQSGGRFQRLEEESEPATSESNYSTTVTSPRPTSGNSTAPPPFYASAVAGSSNQAAPALTLDFQCRDEKRSSLMDSLSTYDTGPSSTTSHSTLARNTSMGQASASTRPDPSPRVSDGSHYADSRFDLPPPAYHSGRESSLYPAGDDRRASARAQQALAV